MHLYYLLSFSLLYYTFSASFTMNGIFFLSPPIKKDYYTEGQDKEQNNNINTAIRMFWMSYSH